MTHLLLIIIYLAFISLGLPDSALGAAWPSMYGVLEVPVSYAGIISMLIALVTTGSSLISHKLTARFGTAKVTAMSAASTAVALMGFSLSTKFWHLCLWTIPYGFGAGGVDTGLNNYVAIHYKSHHMSWLHCMWGVGATLGPAIMGRALTGGFAWNTGYRWISLLQIAISAILFLSLPLWRSGEQEQQEQSEAVSLMETIRMPGVKAAMLCFFGYCALEQTTGLWAASYLALYRGVPADIAAGFGSMYFIGITIGRALSGFAVMKLSDRTMIRMSFCIIGVGIAAMLLPLGETLSLMGLVLIGLGSAPIFPCMIHSTPGFFGAERSQAVIGLQMAGTYIGTSIMPALFGLVANHISVSLLPVYMLLMLGINMIAYRTLTEKCGQK
ncbi:MAG: MFS transporter [Clostridia bacterium]|nr:MFS transporter [Clostridia bacterium]